MGRRAVHSFPQFIAQRSESIGSHDWNQYFETARMDSGTIQLWKSLEHDSQRILRRKVLFVLVQVVEDGLLDDLDVTPFGRLQGPVKWVLRLLLRQEECFQPRVTGVRRDIDLFGKAQDFFNTGLLVEASVVVTGDAQEALLERNHDGHKSVVVVDSVRSIHELAIELKGVVDQLVSNIAHYGQAPPAALCAVFIVGTYELQAGIGAVADKLSDTSSRVC